MHGARAAAVVAEPAAAPSWAPEPSFAAGPAETQPIDRVAASARADSAWPEICDQFGSQLLILAEQIRSCLNPLEADEDDPDRLRRLYQVDHAVTRMRLASRQLRTLAGRSEERQAGFTTSLVDVIRMAASAIEWYPQVTIGPVAELAVLGFAADDVATLMSALLDNATRYSPGMVTVSCHLLEEGGVMFRIEDTGLGIAREKVPRLNAAFAGPVPDVSESTARHTGFPVVHRIARKHSITVRFASRRPPGTGTLAMVTLPPRLLCAIAAQGTPPGPAAAEPSAPPPAATEVPDLPSRGLADLMQIASMQAESALMASPEATAEQAPPLQAVPPEAASIEAASIEAASIEGASIEGASIEAASIEAAPLVIALPEVPPLVIALPEAAPLEAAPPWPRRRWPRSGRAPPGSVGRAGPRPGRASPRATTPGTAEHARRRAEAGRGRRPIAATTAITATTAATVTAGGGPAGLRRRPQRVLPGHPGRSRRPRHHRQPGQRDVQRCPDRGRRAVMSNPTELPPSEPQDFGWLVDNFALSTPGVTHALIVSSDGLPLVTSTGLAPDLADPLAAMTSGIISIGNNIASQIGEPGCEQVMLKFPSGHFLFMGIGSLAGFAVLVDDGANLGVVGHQMARLVDSVGHLLTPQLRDDLRRMSTPVTEGVGGDR